MTRLFIGTVILLTVLWSGLTLATRLIGTGRNQVVSYTQTCAVFLVDAGGQRLPRPVLMDSRGCILASDWSPDGSRIAYTSGAGRGNEIFVADVSPAGVASNRRQLTSDNRIVTDPTWSPDGANIAYWRGAERAGEWDLRMVNADGGDEHSLGAYAVTSPRMTWSPNGRYLAFAVGEGTASELFLVDVVDGARRQLTHNNELDRYPAWSPDSRRIVYSSGDGGTFNLFLLDLAGGEPARLFHDVQYALLPSWSPDGSSIVYVRFLRIEGRSDLFVVNVDGTNNRRLTNLNAVDFLNPTWLP